jgi:hypothetical protein
MEQNVFNSLNGINLNDKVEKKANLTYLNWTWAWAEVKKLYPDANYTIGQFPSGTSYNGMLPYQYDPKLGYMVWTTVTIGEQTHSMWLPVMDGANKAMKDHSYEYLVTKWEGGRKIEVKKECEAATMFDINKTIMRCLTKNLAMFGLGLYIYAGEDLPEVRDGEQVVAPPVKADVKKPTTPIKPKEEKVSPSIASTKPTISFVPLVKDDSNWSVAMAYVSNNKVIDFEKIIQQLNRKYMIDEATKAEIKKVWEAK